jgi:hypothetical protein
VLLVHGDNVGSLQCRNLSGVEGRPDLVADTAETALMTRSRRRQASRVTALFQSICASSKRVGRHLSFEGGAVSDRELPRHQSNPSSEVAAFGEHTRSHVGSHPRSS